MENVLKITVITETKNTDLDDRPNHVQVVWGKEKYKNAEYDDNTVECLMKYLE